MLRGRSFDPGTQRRCAPMVKRFATTLACCLISGVASAQYMLAEGTYSSREADVRVVLLDSEKGVAAASVAVALGGCSGTVAGIGQIRARILAITPYAKVPGGESCRVELAFDAAWKRVKIIAHECQAYHGASCGFEGQTATRRNQR
ncbi:MAG: hypothetical protein JWP22_1736 [Ramlibacter sp.]|nr:hypothetical protein [Ramlibacter sp.]